MRLEPDGQVEDYVLLVVNQNEAVSFIGTELHSLQDVSVVVEGFLAEAQLGLALYEIGKHVDVEGNRSKSNFFRPVAAEAIAMHFPQLPLDLGYDDILAHIESDL